MVNMMKALVFTAPHTFEYRDVPRPEPAPDEVLVEVKACAICGSDVHGSSGENGRRIPPLVMGHEASGTIAQLGEAVQGWAVGDRVTFDSTEYCGHCWFCTHGMHNLCAQRRIVGVACTEYRKNGAMAQYIAVKARTLYALPPTVSFEQGCLVEPFAVGMHAVLRSGLATGQTAAVIGDGTAVDIVFDEIIDEVVHLRRSVQQAVFRMQMQMYKIRHNSFVVSPYSFFSRSARIRGKFLLSFSADG